MGFTLSPSLALASITPLPDCPLLGHISDAGLVRGHSRLFQNHSRRAPPGLEGHKRRALLVRHLELIAGRVPLISGWGLGVGDLGTENLGFRVQGLGFRVKGQKLRETYLRTGREGWRVT